MFCQKARIHVLFRLERCKTLGLYLSHTTMSMDIDVTMEIDVTIDIDVTMDIDDTVVT